MKKSWTTTKLLTIGGLSVLKLLITILIYTTTLTSTGSIFSGFLSLFLGPFFTILSILILNQFGAGFLYNIVRTLLELPLPMIFPPLTTIIFSPSVGLITDILFVKLKSKRKTFAFLSGCIYNLFWLITGLAVFFLIGLSVSVSQSLLTPKWIALIGLAATLLGGLSGLSALFIFEKMKNTSLIARIQKSQIPKSVY